MRHRFEEWELDEDARQLRGSRGPVHLEPQVFDVLAYLITNRDRAVAKTELLQEVWGHDFVSESALTSRIKSARAAIGDNGRDQRHVRTVHGFGYQFVSPVSSTDGPASASRADRAEPRRSMPSFHNPFRGRDGDCAEAARLLGQHRLVTVLGPGGIGKTRLAVEVVGRADREVEPFDLPVRFVDLASTRDEAGIPDVLAVALGIEIGQRRDPTDAVCEHLATIPHLLVLDNCEHVLAATAAITTDLLGRTDATRVLATSRVPLGIPGERLHRLGPLPVPADDVPATPDTVTASPAVAVFLDRAQLAGADPLVDQGDAELLAGLCRALDGLPLALELAAGRLSAFSLTDLVGLLDRRLDLIGERSSTREHRHRTLRATVEWSYDLLEPAEQRLFRFLSVFPGGLTLDGVQWLAARLGVATGLESAAHLVDASLLTTSQGRSGSRCAQLETLRTFGLDQLDALGEADDAGALLVAFVLELAAQIDAGVRTPDEPAFVDLLREELPNVRAASARLRTQGQVDELIQLLRLLGHWARCRDADEVWAWSDDLLARVPADDPRHADVRAIHALAAWRRGDIDGARVDGLAGLGGTEPWAVRQASAELVTSYMFSGDLDDSERSWLRHAELDEAEFGYACAAMVAAYAGRDEDARRYLDEADARAQGSISYQAWRDYTRAEVANAVGIADVESLERAIEAARSVDASFIVGVAMVTLTSIHAAAGDVGHAADRYADLIGHWLRSGSWTQQWTTLRQVAALLEHTHPELALTILRAADADPLSPSLHADSLPAAEALVERLRRRVGADVATGGAPSRLEVAEQAAVALRELASAHHLAPQA